MAHELEVFRLQLQQLWYVRGASTAASRLHDELWLHLFEVEGFGICSFFFWICFIPAREPRGLGEWTVWKFDMLRSGLRDIGARWKLAR